MLHSKYESLKIQVPVDFDFENDFRTLYRYHNGRFEYFYFESTFQMDEFLPPYCCHYCMEIIGRHENFEVDFYNTSQEVNNFRKKVAKDFNLLLKDKYRVTLILKCKRDLAILENNNNNNSRPFKSHLHQSIKNNVKLTGIGEIGNNTDYINVDYTKDEVTAIFNVIDKEMFIELWPGLWSFQNFNWDIKFEEIDNVIL